MNLRSLPRIFVPGATSTAPIALERPQLDRLQKVLRLGNGDKVGVLPNDGNLMVCVIEGKTVVPIEVHALDTEPQLQITIAQATPKGDKIDEVVRACTELGAVRFILFAAERTVVRWDPAKLVAKVERLGAIARESAELSFRGRAPRFDTATDLQTVLGVETDAIVLSEVDSVKASLRDVAKGKSSLTLVIGPEGGWSPREVEMIGDRSVTLGPRVLRTEHAGAAALASLLIP